MGGELGCVLGGGEVVSLVYELGGKGIWIDGDEEMFFVVLDGLFGKVGVELMELVVDVFCGEV